MKKPKFQLGKILNKYLILDIFTYSSNQCADFIHKISTRFRLLILDHFPHLPLFTFLNHSSFPLSPSDKSFLYSLLPQDFTYSLLSTLHTPQPPPNTSSHGIKNFLTLFNIVQTNPLFFLLCKTSKKSWKRRTKV